MTLITQRSAQAFYYQGGKVGVLLIHGFTGTPSELRPLGHYLYKLGYTVSAPLLAGHGTTPEDMGNTYWTDWWQTVIDSYDVIKASGVERIYAVGLSMGGCLALYLSLYRELDGAVAMCAPIWIRGYKVKIVRLANFFIKYTPRSIKKPLHIERHLVPYERIPLSSVISLKQFIAIFRKALPAIRTPAFIIQARNDESISPRSAEYIYENIGSKIKRLSWYEESGHIITVDKEHHKLFDDIRTFIEGKDILIGS